MIHSWFKLKLFDGSRMSFVRFILSCLFSPFHEHSHKFPGWLVRVCLMQCVASMRLWRYEVRKHSLIGAGNGVVFSGSARGCGGVPRLHSQRTARGDAGLEETDLASWRRYVLIAMIGIHWNKKGSDVREKGLNHMTIPLTFIVLLKKKCFFLYLADQGHSDPRGDTFNHCSRWEMIQIENIWCKPVIGMHMWNIAYVLCLKYTLVAFETKCLFNCPRI